MSRRSDVITLTRQALKQAIEGMQELEHLGRELESMARRLEPLTDADFVGANADLHPTIVYDEQGNEVSRSGGATRFMLGLAAAQAVIADLDNAARDKIYPVLP